MAKLQPLKPGHALADKWLPSFFATNCEKRFLLWFMHSKGKRTVTETLLHILWGYARACDYPGPYPGDFELAALQATPIATEEDNDTANTTEESTTGTKKKGTHKTHARHTAPRRGETPQPAVTPDTSGSNSETTSGQTTEALALV